MGSARLLGAYRLARAALTHRVPWRSSVPCCKPSAVLAALASLLPLAHAAAPCALQVPAVRVAAIGGVCTVLDKFWELIPAGTIAGFVKRIASKHCAPAPLLCASSSAPLTVASITNHGLFSCRSAWVVSFEVCQNHDPLMVLSFPS